MLSRSDVTVYALGVTLIVVGCLLLVGLGFVAGKLDNQFPICERHITVRDGANVTHEFVVECGK